MNKRGFIKTLEAVLAVIIVFIFIFTLSQKSSSDNNIKTMRDMQEGLLSGISKNDNFRSCIVSAQKASLPYIGAGNAQDPCFEEDIKGYITKSLPSRFVKQGDERYRMWVCDVDDCTLPELSGKYVYTSAVIISSDLEDYKPRIFRIWMW